MSFNVLVPKGKYIVAVSGGVDSMVLLDKLNKIPGLSLVVAHFDHGIRPDSKLDRLAVERVSRNMSLVFTYKQGKLGAEASEELARKVRYDFLNSVLKEHQADAIITAHHRDDVLETAIINLLRGTGRRGISALRSNPKLIRPLLEVPKEDLIKYAHSNNIKWREDPTNMNTKYLRNYIRHVLLPKFNKHQKEQLLSIINGLRDTNTQIDQILEPLLKTHLKNGQLDRQWFIMLPNAISKELMATWLRLEGIKSFDRKSLQKLVVAAKTLKTDRTVDVSGGYSVVIKQKYLALTSPDRY